MPPPRARHALAVACLLVVGACLSPVEEPSDGRPKPSPRGVAISAVVSGQVDASGGSLTSSDGRLTMSVPPGAFSAPTTLTIQDITNTAPGGIGSAYRIGPEGTLFATPITLTFQADPAADLGALTIGYQEQQGFWLRYKEGTRDDVAKTVSVTTTHLSDWALVTRSLRDMRGTFTLETTRGRPFTASGEATLNFAGEDTGGSYFLQWGSMTVSSPIVDGATTCTASGETTSSLQANIAEVTYASQRFAWGVDGHWEASCTDGSGGWSELLVALFDTVGVNYVGCARYYDSTPVVDPDHLAGTYTIDCGVWGAVTASWDFVTCTPDVPCQPSSVCRTGAISCDTGFPVCAEIGNVANGTTCGTDMVCSDGTCVACTADQACTTNPNQCVQGVTSCATGTETCVDTGTPVASLGTACSVPDSCWQGAVTCVASQPTCTETTTPLPAATPCPGGVCSGGGVCNACTEGLTCSTNPNQCVVGVTSCATGAETCVDTATPVPSLGTACSVPDSCWQGAVTCVANQPACTETTTPLPAATPCPGGVCSGGGTCNACTAGLTCSTNPNQCVVGVTSCATGIQTCEDSATPVASLGTACTLSGSCWEGAISCVANQPTCTATTTPLPAATPCPGGVCNGSGTCNSCTAGQPCTTNSDHCVQGVTSCATGTQTCENTVTPVASIGTACTLAGSCWEGAVTCVSSEPTCTATTTPLPAATPCPGGVCSGGGTCNACTAGLTCSTNPNQCVVGVTSCATGIQTCEDSATPVASMGTACTVLDSCWQGAVTCVASQPTCTETTVPLSAGTGCPGGVCNGSGTCTACTAGQPCSTNSDHCVQGVTSCATGTQTCENTATPVASIGTACTLAGSCWEGAITCVSSEPTCTATTTPLSAGTACPGGVCDGSGTCNACTAAQACTTNPNHCVEGVTSCATGTQTCENTATNVASLGTSCVITGSCFEAQVTCVSNEPTCTETTTPLAAGTSCGVDHTCGGGTCNFCQQDAPCTSSNPCQTATYECSTGFAVCTDRANVGDGTSCPGGVCGGGVCNACTEGASCTPTDECHVGAVACGSGYAVCADTGANAQDGSSCSAGSCNAGSCVASRTVTGTRRVSHWLDSGAQETAAAPDVLVSPFAAVEALYPDAAGGFVAYPGTFSIDGSFSIPHVPVGTYWLVFAGGDGVVSAFETSSDVVDLGYDQLGRSDVAVPTGSTPVTFDLTPPLASGDVFQATASNADVQVSRDVATLPQDATIDWFTGGGGAPLNLLTAADVLYVHELAAQTAAAGASNHAYRAAGGWASVTGTVVDDLVAEIVTTTLAAAPQTGSLPVAPWALPAFEALLPAMAPPGMTTDATHTLSVGASAHPLTSPAPRAAGTPTLLTMTVPAGTGDLTTDVPLAYGQFLDPFLWAEWREVRFTGQVIYTKPPAIVSLEEETTVGRREPMPAATPLTPDLYPVEGPLVSGASVFTPPPAVGVSPTFSWLPPAAGVPTRYTLIIYRLDELAGSTTRTRVASWTTAAPSVTVPEGFLEIGQTYYARIVAIAMPGDSFTTAPFRSSPLSSYATTLTAPFTP